GLTARTRPRSIALAKPRGSEGRARCGDGPQRICGGSSVDGGSARGARLVSSSPPHLNPLCKDLRFLGDEDPRMPLKGTLDTMSLPDVLQWLGTARKTGVVTLAQGAITKKLFLENGL